MNMNSIRKIGLALGALTLGVLFAPPARASAPALMTYQGRLRESGLPVNAVRSIDVQICNALSGPTCFSGSGAQNVVVSSGLFRTTFTPSPSVDLTTGQWYLEVSVGGSALSPREQLTSSAYAIYASTAGSLSAGAAIAGATITAAAQGGTLENVARFNVSDDINHYLQIMNNTTTSNEFNPKIFSFTQSTLNPGLKLEADSNDSANTDGIVLNALASGGPLINRNLLSVQNNGSSKMIVTASGKLGLGTAGPSYDVSLGSGTSKTFGIEDSAATGAGGSLTIRAGTAGPGGGAAGSMSLLAGSGPSTLTGPGGAMSVQAGAGGGTGGNGGAVTVQAGAATAGGGTGGTASVQAGNGAGVGAGGAVTVQAGTGGGGGAAGGDVTIQAGTAGGATNAGGSVHLLPGAPGASGAAGYVEVGGTSAVSHLRSTQTTAPTITNNGSCGTIGTLSATGGTDLAGLINYFATGGSATAACVFTVTFNKSYAAAPKMILLTPATAAAAAPGGGGPNAFVDSTSAAAGTFQIKFGVAPANSTAYAWYYYVIE